MIKSRIQISEPSPSSVEKKNSSKDQAVLEKSLYELESIQMEDEIKKILVTIINLVISWSPFRWRTKSRRYW
jgi:hypothetical protein